MAVAAYKSIDQIWNLLEGLKNEDKIELAARLMDSLRLKKSPKKEKLKLEEKTKEDWKKLSGAWADDGQTAEELIKFIRESRFTNRQIESFD